MLHFSDDIILNITLYLFDNRQECVNKLRGMTDYISCSFTCKQIQGLINKGCRVLSKAYRIKTLNMYICNCDTHLNIESLRQCEILNTIVEDNFVLKKYDCVNDDESKWMYEIIQNMGIKVVRVDTMLYITKNRINGYVI